jgi:S-adenosyl methyltransferase
VRYLAGQRGIRQFLDIGPGLPVPEAMHKVAQDIAPECRIVYVDNDRYKSVVHTLANAEYDHYLGGCFL